MRRHKYHWQQGMALIMVLWLLTLLSIMAAAFSLTARRGMELAQAQLTRARALALAEGGVHYALLRLSLPATTQRWRGDGVAHALNWQDAQLQIRLYDEAGKIDFNQADEQLLRTFFLGQGLSTSEAMNLADTVLDWRDADTQKRTYGGEDAEYRQMGLHMLPNNHNFQNLQEVSQVLGMTPQLYRQIRPVITVYSGQNGFNPLKAKPALLEALPDLDLQALDNYRNQPAGSAMPPLPNNNPAIRFTAAADMVYEIACDVMLADEDAIGMGLRVIVRRDSAMTRRQNALPFAVLDWREVSGRALRDSAD